MSENPFQNKLWRALLCCLAGLFLSACRTDSSSRFDPRKPTAATPGNNVNFSSIPTEALLTQPSTNYFTLGPGDRIEIGALDENAPPTQALVGPDGKIYYSILPGLDVWGLTLAETKAKLERGLASFYRSPPQLEVTLRVVGSKRVWLLGRLVRPGLYPLTGPTTLLEAVSQAGGPVTSLSVLPSSSSPLPASIRGGAQEQADLRHSFVVRQGHLLPIALDRLFIAGDLSQNIYLEPDDFVYIAPAAGPDVYVLGAVRDARAVRMRQPATLLRAIAAAGGIIKDAYVSHVAIVRGSLARPKIAVVDLAAIEKGGEPDLELEAHDIVYVPFTPYRTLTRYAYTILDTFGRTVGANEGARAISRRAGTVGAAVPLQ